MAQQAPTLGVLLHLQTSPATDGLWGMGSQRVPRWLPGGESQCSANVCAQTSHPCLFIRPFQTLAHLVTRRGSCPAALTVGQQAGAVQRFRAADNGGFNPMSRFDAKSGIKG